MRLKTVKYLKSLLGIVMVVLLVSSCATLEEETKDWSAARLYRAAKSALDTADYETALKHLETLEARYPFGRFAQQAQLDMIYAYYKFDEPDSSIAAADRFIKLYPRHVSVDYAYYMRGLASFNKGMGALDYLLKIDATKRDPRSVREAYNYFSSLVKNFPESIYAADAVKRLIHLHNHLGQYELHVADFYLRRGANVAAANRAKYVVEKFQRTPASREALYLLYESYTRLGLYDLASDVLRVLELNVPNHPALAELRAEGPNRPQHSVGDL